MPRFGSIETLKTTAPAAGESVTTNGMPPPLAWVTSDAEILLELPHLAGRPASPGRARSGRARWAAPSRPGVRLYASSRTKVASMPGPNGQRLNVLEEARNRGLPPEEIGPGFDGRRSRRAAMRSTVTCPAEFVWRVVPPAVTWAPPTGAPVLPEVIVRTADVVPAGRRRRDGDRIGRRGAARLVLRRRGATRRPAPTRTGSLAPWRASARADEAEHLRPLHELLPVPRQPAPGRRRPGSQAAGSARSPGGGAGRRRGPRSARGGRGRS